MLDHGFRGRMAGDLRDNASAGNKRPTNQSIVAIGNEQNLAQVQRRADSCITMVDANKVADRDSILPRSILENCIHG
jgi:hypothetical protein